MEFLLEGKKTAFLLQSFELAKDYFEKNPKSLADANLNMHDIEHMYEYAEKHKNSLAGMPEPIVADYKGSDGAIAFRKWVKKLFPDIRDNGKCRGFHNTTINASNTADSWKPSPQDMESVICLACNNINDMLTAKQKNVLIDAQKKLTAIQEDELTEDEIADSEKANIFYLKHKEELDAIAKTLSSKFKDVQFNPMDKLAANDPVSEEWKIAGNYAMNNNVPNKTPKTDIISKDGKIRVSLKQADKGSQLMSGRQAEATATLKSAIKSIGKEEKYKALISIFDNPDFKFEQISKRGLTQDELKAKQIAGKEKMAEVNKMLKDACDSDVQLKYAIMHEAATGAVKFGEDASSAANAILVWSIDNPKLNYADDIDAYLKHVIDRTKIYIAFKGTDAVSVQTLKVILPKQTAR